MRSSTALLGMAAAFLGAGEGSGRLAQTFADHSHLRVKSPRPLRAGAKRAAERLARHRKIWDGCDLSALEEKREAIERRQARRGTARRKLQPPSAREIAVRRSPDFKARMERQNRLESRRRATGDA